MNFPDAASRLIVTTTHSLPPVIQTAVEKEDVAKDAEKELKEFEAAIVNEAIPELAELLEKKPQLLDHTFSPEQRTSFHICVTEKACESLKYLLSFVKKNPKFKHLINQRNEKKISPIDLACKENQIECVQLLLDADADINFEEFTPMHIAAVCGHTEVMQLLYKKDAKIINAKTSEGCSPLYVACSGGKESAVAFLLRLDGVDIHEFNGGSQTAMHAAALGGHLEVMKLLYEKDPTSVKAITSEGYSILYIACSTGHLNIVEFLLTLDDIDINEKNGDDQDTAFLAATKGGVEIMKLLYKKDPNTARTANKKGYSPLYIACLKRDEEAVAFLIDLEEVDIHQVNASTGATAMHIAAREGHSSIMMQLFRKDSTTIKAKLDDGRTPFYIACERGHLPCVEFLISLEEVDINDRNLPLDETGLVIAVHNGHVNIVKLLLSHGARFDVKTKDNQYKIQDVQCNPEVADLFVTWQAERIPSPEIESFSYEFFYTLLKWLSDQYLLSKVFLVANHQNESFQRISKETIFWFFHKPFINKMNEVLESFNIIEEENRKKSIKKLKRICTYLTNIHFLVRDNLKGCFGTVFQDPFSKALLAFRSALEKEKNKLVKINPEQQFDNSDIFSLLSRFNIGTNQTNTDFGISAGETYVNTIGCDAPELYEFGLMEGRDLRAIGIPFTVFLLCEKLERDSEIKQLIQLEVEKTLNNLNHFLDKIKETDLSQNKIVEELLELKTELIKYLSNFSKIESREFKELTEKLYSNYCLLALKAFILFNERKKEKINKLLNKIENSSLASLLEMKRLKSLRTFVGS